MTRGNRGTSTIGTLSRAVANIARTEDDATYLAAMRILARAYHDEDRANGRECPTPCMFCSAAPPSPATGNEATA